MRLKPKQVGHSFSVDDYNAIVYLLGKGVDSAVLEEMKEIYGYTKDELNELSENIWCDKNIKLSTEGTIGQFATYKLSDTNKVFQYTSNSYVIQPKTKREFRVIITNTLLDTANYDLLLKYHSTENNMNEDPNESTGNTSIVTISGLHKGINTVKLPDTIKEGLFIEPNIDVHIHLNQTPEIDPWNGKANEPDEILVYPKLIERDGVQQYVWDDLQKLIAGTPKNGRKHIYRLVNNGKHCYLRNEIRIQPGQNIEIRGGTNVSTIIDGTYCSRIFYIHPNAKLTLHKIHLKNCDNTDGRNPKLKDARYFGGAIYVAFSPNYGMSKAWGSCYCTNCFFTNCTARRGGAIYSSHGYLYVTNCFFTNCNGREKGGAIYYSQEKEVLNA